MYRFAQACSTLACFTNTLYAAVESSGKILPRSRPPCATVVLVSACLVQARAVASQRQTRGNFIPSLAEAVQRGQQAGLAFVNLCVFPCWFKVLEG